MDWITQHAAAVWLGVMIVLGVAELASLDLVLAMVAAGAGAGAVTAVLGGPIVVQVLVAAGASAAMLSLVRPSVLKRLHTGPELRLGHGRLVGQRATVTEEITGLHVGRVDIAGDVWSAAPYDETLVIALGETVEVLEIRGATAYVHPVHQLEP